MVAVDVVLYRKTYEHMDVCRCGIHAQKKNIVFTYFYIERDPSFIDNEYVLHLKKGNIE